MAGHLLGPTARSRDRSAAIFLFYFDVLSKRHVNPAFLQQPFTSRIFFPRTFRISFLHHRRFWLDSPAFNNGLCEIPAAAGGGQVTSTACSKESVMPSIPVVVA